SRRLLFFSIELLLRQPLLRQLPAGVLSGKFLRPYGKLMKEAHPFAAKGDIPSGPGGGIIKGGGCSFILCWGMI
ncbi:MAG: hypothetical protein ACOWWO_08790, partial [Peptococcaceae bacterium]